MTANYSSNGNAFLLNTSTYVIIGRRIHRTLKHFYITILILQQRNILTMSTSQTVSLDYFFRLTTSII